MRTVRIDRDFAAVCRGGRGSPWQRFVDRCGHRHRAYYEELHRQVLRPLWPSVEPAQLFERTWRAACLKLASGAWPVSPRAGQGALEAAIASAHERCLAALGATDAGAAATPPWLSDSGFDVYVGFGFGAAPATSLLVGGRPAIALHFEHPQCRPELLETLVTHEFAHCARSAALGLPLSPAELGLADMIAYEGTAARFADAVLGLDTLGQMMSADDRRWHEENEAAVRAAFQAERDGKGMRVALRWFSAGGRPSGYWLGARLCDAWRGGTLADLLAAPTAELTGWSDEGEADGRFSTCD